MAKSPTGTRSLEREDLPHVALESMKKESFITTYLQSPQLVQLENAQLGIGGIASHSFVTRLTGVIRTEPLADK